jgi:predicted neuraminidase
MRRAWLVVFSLAAFGIGFYKVLNRHVAMGFAIAQPAAASAAPFFKSGFVSSKLNTQTHAASLIELKGGNVRAFWFSGSREGAKDVEIHSAVFDAAQGGWGKEETVATREGAEQSLQRYIAKLGNPVPVRMADGKLWLYYVTVSVGGWAGSSITAIHSEDEGRTWSRAEKLVTSPFLNISTLVKGAAFTYSDGTVGLPVYHEFITKFGEILHLDKNGDVLDKQRLIAGGSGALQPVMLVQNSNEAFVLMRNASNDNPRKVIGVATTDGGERWGKPVKLPLLNPDAALSAVVLRDGRILAALNNQEHGRDTLSLMVSSDGGTTWKTAYQMEDEHGAQKEEAPFAAETAKLAGEMGVANPSTYAESARAAMCEGQCRFEFSYPYLISAANGDLHLAYTWNRSQIKHVAFNEAWLNRQLEKAP